MLIRIGINIKLITINKIWSFNEIFLWYLRPTRQKNVPKKSETNKVTMYEFKSKIKFK